MRIKPSPIIGLEPPPQRPRPDNVHPARIHDPDFKVDKQTEDEWKLEVRKWYHRNHRVVNSVSMCRIWGNWIPERYAGKTQPCYWQSAEEGWEYCDLKLRQSARETLVQDIVTV